nr:MAG TPA: hypothetical protein [Caudoviricetes sp.]
MFRNVKICCNIFSYIKRVIFINNNIYVIFINYIIIRLVFSIFLLGYL